MVPKTRKIGLSRRNEFKRESELASMEKSEVIQSGFYT